MRVLFAIFALTFIAHAGFALFVAHNSGVGETYPILGSDSVDYAQIARTLLHSGQFYAGDTHQLLFRRPPLYPTLIAGTMFLFGESVGPLITIIIQLFLFALATALTLRIARVWISQKQSIAVALLFALEPATWYATATLLSDAMFLALLVASIFFLVVPSSRIKRNYIISAVLLALAVLTRSIAQFFPIIILLYFICHENTNLLRLKRGALYLACFLLTLAPWMYWSNQAYGSMAISTDGVAVHFIHTLPEFLSLETGQNAQEISERLRTLITSRAEQSGQTMTTLMAEESSRIVFGNPFAYAKFHIVKTLPFFLSDGVREMFAHIHLMNPKQPNIGNYLLRGDFFGLCSIIISTPTLIVAILGALGWLLIWATVIIGTLSPPTRTGLPRNIVMLCVLLILLQAALIGPASTPRHRIPALPWIFLLAVPGVKIAVECLFGHSQKDPDKGYSHQGRALGSTQLAKLVE